MASSTNEETRTIAARALRAVGSSTHSDVKHAGSDAVAALPVPEAAAMVDVVEGWLTPEFAPVSASPHTLLKRLAEGGEMAAALRVTAALFRISRRDGEATSFFDLTMYDYYLMTAVGSLEKAGPLQALPQFCDALMEASRLDPRPEGIKEEDYSYYTDTSLEPSPTGGTGKRHSATLFGNGRRFCHPIAVPAWRRRLPSKADGTHGWSGISR